MTRAAKRLRDVALASAPGVARCLAAAQGEFAVRAMDHPSMFRRVFYVLLCGAWVFVLLSLGSFHATDWPSHAVYPYPPVQNVCGNPGAFIAYYSYFVLGQGVYPVLFFSGVCVALYTFGNRVSDLWLRVIGLGLLAAAFAAVVHLVKPGSRMGLPEGNGGILGIGAASFLRSHCNAVLTSLILVCTFIVGLLLCADDLVVRAPGYIGRTIRTVREKTPGLGMNSINFKFPTLPRLPSLPTFVTKDSATAGAPARLITTDEVGTDEEGGSAVLNRGPDVQAKNKPSRGNDDIHLVYDNDEPAAAADDTAWRDVEDPGPSAPATIPPPGLSRVPEPALPPMVIRNSGSVVSGPPAQPLVAKLPPATRPAPEPEASDDAHAEASAIRESEDHPSPIAGSPAAHSDASPKPEMVVKLPTVIKAKLTAPPPAAAPARAGRIPPPRLGLPRRAGARLRRGAGRLRPRKGRRPRAGAARFRPRHPRRRDRHRPGDHHVRDVDRRRHQGLRDHRPPE